MELNGSGYLYTLAILGITFASMSAIVVVLRHTTGARVSPFQLYLTTLYIEWGFMVAGLSMLPMLLSLFAVPHPIAWQAASAIAAAALGIHSLSLARRRRAVEKHRLPRSVRILRGARGLAILALLVDATGMPVPINVGIYAVVMSYFLGLVFFMFSVRLHAFLANPE